MALNIGYLTAKTDKASDEVYTPAYAVKPILKYIDKGNKPQYANYTLFALEASVKPRKQFLKGVPDVGKGNVIGQVDGWMQNLGSTGLCSLENGLYYISHSSKSDLGQGSTLRLYRYTSDGQPFKKVE